MSFSGSFTPLQLNAISALSMDVGFRINSTARSLQGTWTPSSYTQGTVTNTTALNDLTTKIKSVYDGVVAATITPDVYRRMLLIGSEVCPALGNSRPSSFKPSYPGYGSWTDTTLNSANFPPKNYPTSGTYSYIHQAYGDYAWVTGWPGANQWQKVDDTYSAAYLPATGDSISDYDEYFSNGFVATVARQAYYEMWSGQFTQYNCIVNSFSQASSFKDSQNSDIASFVNTKTFMSGVYSNINDLTTSDIAGVNLAFNVWGNDLINSGRSINLLEIAKFGLPSVLLRNLQLNNVVTEAVSLALIYSELNPIEISSILSSGYTPTVEQERKIYRAFLLVSGDDLHDSSRGVMYGLNCKTTGIETLADLLNPLKLFPNSYNSLTLPRYSATTQSAKIYDFIYVDGGVNSRIQNWGDYLEGILPPDLAISCGAFSMTMGQIKNISTMDIERFCQVVTNLELVNKDLPLINTADGVPGSVPLADSMLARIALGSGNSNAYRQCDFYGAASGYPYSNYFELATALIKQLTTPTLQNIYSTYPVTTDLEVEALVTAANNEISRIASNNPRLCEQLNYYWNAIGNQLFIEQRAIPLCFPISTSVPELISDSDFTSFVRQLEGYAQRTSGGEEAPTLEAISDLTLIGGQSLVASLREARNASRVGLMGGGLQNNVPTEIDVCSASATATVVGGTITSVAVTSASTGYTASNPPTITVYPVGHGAILTPVLAADGSISSILITAGGSGYPYASIEISAPPQCQPANPPQQTYADTAESQLVPPELTAIGPQSLAVSGPSSASPTVAEAIAEVVACNCDCWA